LTEDKQHWIMDELGGGLTMADLQKIAPAIVDNDYKWTRAITTKAGLSQPKHNKLQGDLVRLTLLMPFPNNANGYNLSRTGKHLFLQLAPHK